MTFNPRSTPYLRGYRSGLEEKIAEQIEQEHGLSVGVVNARFAKPLDMELLTKQAQASSLLVTMEDHVVTGGPRGAGGHRSHLPPRADRLAGSIRRARQ